MINIQKVATEQGPTAVVKESLGALIDTAGYPIDNPGNPVRANLVKSCRRQLAKSGCARLQAFINPEALVAMSGEVDERLSLVDKTTDIFKNVAQIMRDGGCRGNWIHRADLHA